MGNSLRVTGEDGDADEWMLSLSEVLLSAPAISSLGVKAEGEEGLVSDRWRFSYTEQALRSQRDSTIDGTLSCWDVQ